MFFSVLFSCIHFYSLENFITICSYNRECPEEVTEVASTLIFSAARYPDLPELCDLRQIFTAKYGTNMESYANTEVFITCSYPI